MYFACTKQLSLGSNTASAQEPHVASGSHTGVCSSCREGGRCLGSGRIGSSLSDTVGYCTGDSEELQYYNPVCPSTEKTSSRGKVIDKK